VFLLVLLRGGRGREGAEEAKRKGDGKKGKRREEKGGDQR